MLEVSQKLSEKLGAMTGSEIKQITVHSITPKELLELVEKDQVKVEGEVVLCGVLRVADIEFGKKPKKPFIGVM